MKSVVKFFVAAVFSFIAICGTSATAQVFQGNGIVTSINLYHLELSDNKTTNLIFPYAVKSVDRGSADVIVQVVKGFANVLQLKANTSNFKQTNVTVITSDGKFYSFLVDYNSDPKVLNLSFIGNDNKNATHTTSIALSDEHDNEAALNADAASVLSGKSFLHKHIISEQMKLRLASIYLKDGLMWFKLKLDNRSQVDYALNNLSFSIIDNGQAKRTARQEIQLQAVYTKQVESIRGNTMKEIVIAFKSFTLSNTKRLKIQISDKSGGRNLTLLVKARKLLRARLLKT